MSAATISAAPARLAPPALGVDDLVAAAALVLGAAENAQAWDEVGEAMGGAVAIARLAALAPAVRSCHLEGLGEGEWFLGVVQEVGRELGAMHPDDWTDQVAADLTRAALADLVA